MLLLTPEQTQIEVSYELQLAESVGADFAEGLPEDVSEARLQQLAPAVLRYLSQSGDGGFKDGVDKILEWEYSEAENSIKGRFIEERPEGDRVFGFEIDRDEQGWSRNIWMESGDFDDGDPLNFGSIIDRVIPYQDLKIGVEYLPGQVRFPKRRNSKKLRSGYGHMRGYKGADGEALDCYLAPAFFVEGETPTDLIFEIQQLAMDGDFDEHKFMLGYPDLATAKVAYLQELPPEFFGGIRGVDRADLEQYRKPVEMAEIDAEGYGISVDDRDCGNCAFSRTARPDGTGWLNCDKHDFETAATEVCYDWEAKAANMAEQSDDRDIVDEYQAQAAPTIAGEIRDWTDRISRSLDAAAEWTQGATGLAGQSGGIGD